MTGPVNKLWARTGGANTPELVSHGLWFHTFGGPSNTFVRTYTNEREPGQTMRPNCHNFLPIFWANSGIHTALVA